MRRLAAVVAGLVTVATMATLIGAGTAGASTTATTTRGHLHNQTVLWPRVGPGTRGERVVTVQYLLQNKGYKVKADGIYGPATKNAVASFQRKVGFAGTGTVGALTWQKLIVVLSPGSHGGAVRAVQHSLKYAYGFRYVQVMGYYNHETRAAVRAFQVGSKLRPADGVVRPYTWQTMVWYEH